MTTSDDVRALWVRVETIHAVTYFADESRAAANSCGMKGFWMGYFGFRAAPLGAVGADAAVFSGHKMLGPYGIGVLAARPVRVKIPAPMITPTPKTVRSSAVRLFFS